MMNLNIYKVCFLGLLFQLLSVPMGITQHKSTTIVLNDSTLFITIQSPDTVAIITDTAKVNQANQEGRPGAINNEKINPESVLKVFSPAKILWSIIFISITYFLIRTTTNLLTVFAEKSARYRITLKGLIPVFRILGWILVFYIIIQGIIKPPVETIIAVSASLGIAIGFASQDIFKNIFGGLIVIFDQPFKVGDKIEVG